MSDIKGISPSYCTHKILMEDDYKPVIQPQTRLNPKVQDVVKNEIMKLLDSGLIYPILNSSWVSPIYVVPKKGGMTVVLNDNNELIPSRTVTGWRVCIDFCKLNDATQKDHCPLPFIDQMLERLCGNEYYYFLDGFLGFFQIPIAPEDQEKTTFTCPYGTFAYRRMPFGLCNAPATFQRCMTAIFHDMVEDFMEVFMDDFLVFGNSFDCCLANLDRMLARCEETNLVLNWEKCHFMVKEGIVLGHKISGAGIEVDRAKIDVIAKLPYPTNVKGVRSFLGHAGFYRRFIKDFSMISKPMTQLLMKDAKFDFFDDYKKAFKILKEKLTTAPIIISPDWNVPFELMCDASDFVVGAVLGQRIDGKFKPIYYASKTLNNAQEHYTTTEKEVLQRGRETKAHKVGSASSRLCSDNVMRRCVAGNEILEILAHCYSGPTRGHHSASITGRKVYESGFYWPSIFKDAKDYAMRCDACQRSGNISSRSEMPQDNIQLDDALWAFRTAYKMPTGCTPFRLVYGKACHLPVEIEHKAYWALKQCNIDLTAAAKNRFMELNELMELRDEEYENTRIYKERTKRWHDSRLRGDKYFKAGDKVLLFNSRFKMHPGKFKSKWYDPNMVKTVHPYGTVEIIDKNGISFKVNGQRLKKYHGEHINEEEKEVVELGDDTTKLDTPYPMEMDMTYSTVDQNKEDDAGDRGVYFCDRHVDKNSGKAWITMLKDFRLFKYNPGMENRIWSEDDKRRSKEFMEVIERRLKIKRIFRSNECFVSGRLRDVDYRLIQRTE
ncbi:reverse transcriptase domain-containing protein [Tanacetum coccineum]